jgi:hypothetical protein
MRTRVWLTIFAFLLLAVGFQSARAGADLIPAGTVLNIRTTHAVDADSSSPGMSVSAVVDDPIHVDGRMVIRRGSPAMLEVVNVTRSSNMQGRDRVAFKVLWIRAGNRTYSVSTNDVLFRGPSEGKKAARKIGVGAGIGALAGGIFGGGTGAAIGAAAGGTTGAVMTGSGKTHLRIPAETRMQFRLNDSVRVERS